MPREQGQKLIAQNKRARHDYTIGETYEAGLVLTGTEVKALRDGGATMKDSYATIDDGEVWLHNLHIPPYKPAARDNHPPERDRKLLLHNREIDRIVGRIAEKGWTLVPTRIYFSEGRAKVELALARGKDRFDKRETIKSREMKRDMDRQLREAGR